MRSFRLRFHRAAPRLAAALIGATLALSLAPAHAVETAGQAGPAVPEPVWEKVCGVAKDQRECHISRKRLGATGQTLSQVMLIERGATKLIQIAVPPVALIQPGVQLKIDAGAPVAVHYVVCTPAECVALGEIDADFVKRLKRGGNLAVAMLNPQGKPLQFDFSLKGFTAAYDGRGLDPQDVLAREQTVSEELKRKADEARQRLLEAQRQASSQ